MNNINIPKKLNIKTIENSDGTVVPFIYSNLFNRYNDKIIHGYATRLGGVSRGYLSSMNFGVERGDTEENVAENHRRFAQALGYDEKRLIFSKQYHTDHVRNCTEADAGIGFSKENPILDTDGYITDTKNLPLMVFYADCVPILFYAPDVNAVAAVHSGWKGTVGKIGPKTVQKFVNEYKADKSKLICCIGPSICKDCYEIGREVAERFYDIAGKDEEILSYDGNDKFHVSLQRAIRKTLIEEGMLPENIEISNACTSCNHEILFSHRKSNGLRGKLGAVIMIRE